MRRLSVLAVTVLAASFSVVIPAATPVANATATGYRPLAAPQRLVDTRPGQPTADGQFAGIGQRQHGTTLAVDVAGRADLGADVGSVMVNLTVDQPVGPGFLTVWPCDQQRPDASNLNYVAGQTVAVAALSKVAADGTICIFNLAATHLIVDAAGGFPAGTFAPLAAPERLADTRAGGATVDGAFAGAGLRPDRDIYRIRVAGRGTVPVDATAVALNVTATEVTAPGFLTVFPCDAALPNASNVNYGPGLTTANAVFTRLDPSGDVCVFTLQSIHVVVDIAGSFAASVFQPVAEPRRLLDSRPGEATIDGQFAGGGLQQDGSSLQLDVAGRAGIPADATAVVLNVTTTDSAAPGFVTTHPQGSSRPEASNVNFVNGRTVANLVVAALGPTGDVCLFNRTATHLVVDVAGWLTGPPSPDAQASCPTRTTSESEAQVRAANVRRPDLHRAVGTDQIALYICKIPADSTRFDGSQQHNATSEDFAAFANAEVAPYFADVSGGRYAVEFVPLGDIQAERDDGAFECLSKAMSRTGSPYTNVLVADSTLTGGGFASPGRIFVSDSGPDFSVFDRAPAEAERGGWVGGAVISERLNAGTIIHEIGHTVHWPHSNIGPIDEYDNPVDVMSSGFGVCQAGFTFYLCDPGNTLAFNRLASGWLGDGQTVTHTAGTANYLLDRPNAAGVQLLLAPDASQPHSMLTIEARPAVGNDDFADAEGVAVHIVDQVDRFGGLSGVSTARIQQQALGAPDTYEHVVNVGDTVSIHGVTLTVLRRVDDRYEVRVAGSYVTPAGTFFTQSNVLTRQSCASLGLDAALAAGCVL